MKMKLIATILYYDGSYLKNRKSISRTFPFIFLDHDWPKVVATTEIKSVDRRRLLFWPLGANKVSLTVPQTMARGEVQPRKEALTCRYTTTRRAMDDTFFCQMSWCGHSGPACSSLPSLAALAHPASSENGMQLSRCGGVTRGAVRENDTYSSWGVRKPGTTLQDRVLPEHPCWWDG